jgi:putative component of membrane protein insertase Oxa1/YidC/SpoIIIJ protein YidD
VDLSLPPAPAFGNDVGVHSLPARLLAGAIRVYQRTLSPDHGPLRALHPYGYCRHQPTCSEFTRKAVLERGAVVGTLMGVRRVLTCHPWRKPNDAAMEKAAKRWLGQE